MITSTADLADVVVQLAHIGRGWCWRSPHYTDISTQGRIEGAAFCVLVLLDGASGLGAVQLTPQGQPEWDLGGDALHETFSNRANATYNSPDRREFMNRFVRIVDIYSTHPGPVFDVMGLFLLAVCHMLAAHYELRLVACDRDGGYVSAGDDVAPGLPAAFASTWGSLALVRDMA